MNAGCLIRESRRRIGCATLVLVALLSPPVGSAQRPNFLSTHETVPLGNGLYAFRFGPYRNIFVVGKDGVIATDPLNVDAAKALRAEIAKITDKPVKYVAYSHSHWDHATGGEIFKKEGAKFVAQERCRANMRETPNADVVEPDIVFKDKYKISVGDASLEMFYFGPNHSDCLSVMIARPANILFVVDLANPPSGWNMEWNPTLPDTYIWNLVPSLKAIEELARREGVTTFVGGHVSIGKGPDGRPKMEPAVGPVSAIAERREYWETLIGAVRTEMAKGTFAENVASKLEGSAYESRIDDFNKDDMAILLRRLASFVFSGR